MERDSQVYDVAKYNVYLSVIFNLLKCVLAMSSNYAAEASCHISRCQLYLCNNMSNKTCDLTLCKRNNSLVFS